MLDGLPKDPVAAAEARVIIWKILLMLHVHPTPSSENKTELLDGDRYIDWW